MALEFRAISINLIAEDKSEKTPNLNWQVRSADALLVRKSVDRGPGEIEDARVFQSFFMKSLKYPHSGELFISQGSRKLTLRGAHCNDLREKVKFQFTGLSELDLSFQPTMISCE